ncbi:TolC family protein [Selenihalanaerobacter shriftii]|uniref:Outer membrane protein TolC n=1 Tax=Selenihalanaerobacter shriftii TaxID=142842 RepID=A0A1T4JJB9_9FIRM|nr:TolC family protein [Selenihalanaerobacter shriftii]SJZ30249.1 Outer membrane protein TolC [Selenihalanaerobacter shriftii]
MVHNYKKLIFLPVLLALILFSNIAFANVVQDQDNQILTLNLEESIERGWQQNSSLQQMKAQLNAAKAGVSKAEAALRPGLDLNSSYTRFEEIPFGSTSKDNFNHSISFNYLLYQKPAKLQIEQSTYSWKKLKKKYEAQKNNLAYSITQRYYKVLEAQNVVKVTEESLKQVNEHLKTTKAHFEAGTALKTDVLQTKVRKSEMEEKLLQVKNNLELAKVRLKNLLEVDGNKELKLAEAIKVPDVDLSLQEVLDYALNNRADLMATKYEVKKASQGIELAETKDDPSLVFTGKSKKSGSDAIPDGDAWSATVNMKWSLYDGGESDSGVKQAKENLVAAKATLHQQEQAIDLEVREKFLNLEVNRKQILTAQERIEIAKENLRLAELRYREGVATNTEVIDAQVALTDARNTYQERVFDYNVSQAGLLKSIGFSYLSLHNSELELSKLN